MSYTLLTGFVTGGFAAAVLLVLWLLGADSQTDAPPSSDSVEVDFFDTELNIR